MNNEILSNFGRGIHVSNRTPTLRPRDPQLKQLFRVVVVSSEALESNRRSTDIILGTTLSYRALSLSLL
jgi:hypothetical protein